VIVEVGPLQVLGLQILFAAPAQSLVLTIVKSTKTKKDQFDYLAWGGAFSTPEFDPELFARLPGWRQREHNFIAAAVREGRSCTLEELEALRGDDGKPVKPRTSFPATLHLSSLKSRFRTSAPVDDIVHRLREVVTSDSILRNLTAFGEGRSLVRTRPFQGVYGYLWCLALLRRGVTSSMPFTAMLDLEEGIHQETGLWLSLEEAPETLYTWLDTEVSVLLSSVA
jgi:hypothetical protein